MEEFPIWQTIAWAAAPGQAQESHYRQGIAALRGPCRRTSLPANQALPERFMFFLKPKAEWIAAFALAVLMAVTRIHHFGIGTIAPDASTGVFFLAGLLLGSPWFLLAFLVEALVLDGIAIGFLKVANACMTSGYALLAPAYGALWLGGRAFRAVEKIDLFAAAKFVCLAAGGTAVFFVISNLGYFFGSEYYQLGLSEYVTRVSRYFPTYLTVTLFYSVAGAALFLAARRLGVMEPAAAR
jgi:hypothetical protein